MRVGLTDDSLLFREGLARLVTELGFEVAFQAGSVADMEQAIEQAPPDVVIVDVRMPPSFTNEGIVAARQLRAAHPELGVLVLSQYVESSQASRLLAEDGRGVGYLLKDRVSDLDALADAIRRVAAGGTVIDSEVVQRLLAKREDHDALADLTPREREVLGLMAEGHSNTAIGERLFIGQKTVETHIGTIFSKLELFPGADLDRRVRAVLAYLRA
ncbi:MAG TPA: response regulator transcription factor [Candidatus Angelobacter sp.]|nr:response regulator transcription factor [Candidatus Angelobacter sp.]